MQNFKASKSGAKAHRAGTFSAKKRFGQNFLKDEAIKQKIIQAIPDDIAASVRSGECEIIEIGPGLGDLTEKLLAANLRLKSLEIDADLLPHLRAKFAEQIAAKRWELVHTDALDWRSERPYFVAANLPYNVSAPIIMRALCDERCCGLLVMVQAEMAARVLNTDAGPLGLLACAQCDELAHICSVPPAAFEPAPRVNSAVIRLRRGPHALSEADAREFAEFLRRLFSAPRKQLRAVIKHDGKLLALCDEMGLCALRPAQISVSSFLEIFKRMKHERKQNCTQL